MLRIHEAIRGGKYPNCTTLGAELEVSYKTIQRDIDFLRDRWELPIAYHEIEHGFYYSSPVSNLPNVTISRGELVALLVAQKAVEQYRGTPFERPISSAFEKLASSLEETEGIAIHDLSEAFSFKPASLAESELSSFRLAAECVVGEEEVEFDYQTLTGSEKSRRRLQAYHLGCVSDQWYLIGNDPERQAVRTFSMARVENLKKTGAKFKRPADFSIEKILKGSFSIFEARKTEDIRILLDPLAARIAKERRWHSSQKIRSLEDGAAELSLRVGVAPDLESWILSWGAHAQVLAPENLRASIAEQHRRAAEFYAGKVPSPTMETPAQDVAKASATVLPDGGISSTIETHLL